MAVNNLTMPSGVSTQAPVIYNTIGLVNALYFKALKFEVTVCHFWKLGIKHTYSIQLQCNGVIETVLKLFASQNLITVHVQQNNFRVP